MHIEADVLPNEQFHIYQLFSLQLLGSESICYLLFQLRHVYSLVQNEILIAFKVRVLRILTLCSQVKASCSNLELLFLGP